MKCWNSAFNAQGSRLIIVVVQLGAVNANVLLWQVFKKISPCVWPNSGFWCCVFLTLCTTLVLLVSFILFLGRKITKNWHTCLSFFQKEVAKISDLFSFAERVDTGLCTGLCCCNGPVHICRQLSPNLSRDAPHCCYTTKLNKETLDFPFILGKASK